MTLWFQGDLDLWSRSHYFFLNQHYQKNISRHWNHDFGFIWRKVMAICILKYQKATIFNWCKFEVTHPTINWVNTLFCVQKWPMARISPVAISSRGVLDPSNRTICFRDLDLFYLAAILNFGVTVPLMKIFCISIYLES